MRVSILAVPNTSHMPIYTTTLKNFYFFFAYGYQNQAEFYADFKSVDKIGKRTPKKDYPETFARVRSTIKSNSQETAQKFLKTCSQRCLRINYTTKYR
jgi:hypothetical protein